MLLHRLSPVYVSRSNSLIFNFANKKRVWQEVHSKCCPTWTAARRKTVLSPSWNEWQSMVLWRSLVESRPFRKPFGMQKATEPKARVYVVKQKHATWAPIKLGFWFRIINKKVYLHNDNVNRIPDNIWQIVVELSLEYTEFTPMELSVLLLEESQIFVLESSFYRILHERGLLETYGAWFYIYSWWIPS